MKKNLGLREEQFDELVSRLRNGDNALFEIAHRELAKDNIEYLKKRYNVGHFDAKDATFNALFSLKDKLINGKIRYDNIRFVFSKMVYQEYIFLKKARDRALNPKDRTISAYATDEGETFEFREADFDALDTAMQKLDKLCLKIIKSFFYSKLKLKDIAMDLGIGYDSVRKKKQRCMEKLTDLVKLYC